MFYLRWILSSLFFTLFINASLLAQPESDRTYPALYIVIEKGWSDIGDIYPMLYSESLFSATNHEYPKVHSVGLTIGGTVAVARSPVFFGADVGFSKMINPSQENLEGGHFRLLSSRLTNRITFDQDRLRIGAYLGGRVGLETRVGGSVFTGFRWQFNLREEIQYKSTDPEYDLEVRQALEDGLTLRNDLSWVFGGGAELALNDNLNLYVRGTYEIGVADVIRTEVNPFQWSETPSNKVRSITVSLGTNFYF